MKRADFLFSCAWVVSLIGGFLSVFYGEVLRHSPCVLCWYQRIFLFPLCYLLGFALYRGDRTMAIYAMPLALLGLSVALFQTAKELFPHFFSSPCSFEAPCSTAAPLLGGVLSFPLLSAVGFALIFLLLFLSKK